MGAKIPNAGFLNSLDGSAHHLVVFVVNTCDKAMRADLPETRIERLRRNARKALWVGAEGREFEGSGPRLNHALDFACAIIGIDRCVEREINPRLCTGLRDLL